MAEEIELKRLKVLDDGVTCELVLTNFGVHFYKERGLFGQNKTIIPHEAITSVQIVWKRFGLLLVLGLMLLAFSIFSLIVDLKPVVSSLIGEIDQFTLIQYGLLISGMAMLLLFWFYRSRHIQIMSPTGSIGGRPLDYDAALQFYDRILALLNEHRDAGKNKERTPVSKKATQEEEWRL